MTVLVTAVTAWSPAVPVFTSALMSKLFQSSRPPGKAVAVSVRSPHGSSDTRAATDTWYSRRAGTQASSAAPGARRTRRRTRRATPSRRRAPRPGRRQPPRARAGRRGRRHRGRGCVASRARASSARPAARRQNVRVSPSSAAAPAGSGGRQGEVRDEGVRVVLRQRRGPQHAQEVQSRVDGEPQGAQLVDPVRASGAPLDQDLQRHGAGVVRRRLRLRLRRELAEVDPGERRRVRAHARHDRGPGVLALELADLPLAGEHPHRVEHAGAQARLQVVAPGIRLDAGPARDRRHG